MPSPPLSRFRIACVFNRPACNYSHTLLQARNRARGAGGSNSPKRQHRRQFKGVLNDCLRLAESLGVPCVRQVQFNLTLLKIESNTTSRAPGEAEAYCAWLDNAGLVDAVVSDDSDCFCYGAKTVLRNFSTDPKNFSVTRCTARRLREEVGLSGLSFQIMTLFISGGTFKTTTSRDGPSVGE